jgi:hypothetical protein
MGVFLYSPGIKVYVSTQDNGILDLSDDVTSGTMVRRSSGVSSFNFQLMNARRKYDGIFAPNDRIIVTMKRLSWLRVFTGYLSGVPLVTAWPQTVPITAHCSLKRLAYWFWDPGLSVSQNMVANAMTSAKNSDDGGVANAVLRILNDVVGWPPDKVHIAGIPQEWFKWAYKIAKNVEAQAHEADQLAQQFYAILGAGGTVGGNQTGSSVPSGSLKAGSYGGVSLDKGQCDVACLIYNVGVSMSGTELRDCVIAIMTAMQEASLHNPSGGDRDSVGIFQQRPSQGWGTVQQCMNPTHASQAFYKALLGLSNRDSMSPDQAAQAVQRSAYPFAYGQWESMATQIVNVLSSKGGNTSPDSTLRNPLGPSQSGTKAGKALGQDLLKTALDLVQRYPHIPYQLGGDSPPNTPANQITALDCSSFTEWVYFNTTGKDRCPRLAADQSSWCKSGGKIISAEEALKTKGAFIFHGAVGNAEHVELSMGNGHQTVGSHHDGTYAGVVEGTASYWSNGGLAPGLDYSGAGGGGGASDQGFQLSTAAQQPWYNAHDPFDKLFGPGPWVPEFQIDTAVSEALTGVRALLNDQPLLPYIKNLIGSTLRSFSSAPNGDFIAWFPDYYGLWGTAAIMQIEPVELKDFTVMWDDTLGFTTHQFTVAPPSINQLALSTGTVGNVGPLQAITTTGIATIDIPAIMYALFGLEPTKADARQFIDWVYKRFGARPDYQQLPGVVGPQGEFFSALFLFMQSWAYQYNADIPVTFMPEMWPGMLVQIPAFGFQAYVTTVTHSFQMGPGGFFNTVINISAPARLPGNDGDSSGGLIGMPLAGGLVGQPSLPGKGGGKGGGRKVGGGVAGGMR